MRKISTLICAVCFVFLSSGCSTVPKKNVPAEFALLHPGTKQAVVVSVPQDLGYHAVVSVWEFSRGGWAKIGNSFPAVIGRNGIAPFNEKVEGDGRTPSGIFKLQRAFGYEKTFPTRLAYRQVTEHDFWIDDAASADYNQWVTGDVPSVSHEKLRRDDNLYRFAIVIEYNTNPIITGKGSAIFIHIWRSPMKPTAGCVAISGNNIVSLLQWLDKAKNPVVILK